MHENSYIVLQTRENESEFCNCDEPIVKLSQLLQLYLKHHVQFMNLSRSTERNSRASINSFIDVNGDLPVKLITRERISDWVAHMQRTLKPNTIRLNVNRLRSVLLWAEEYGESPAFNVKLMKTPKGERSKPKYLTPQQIQDILDVDPVFSNSIATRNKAIVATLFSTGLRNSELCAVNRNDIEGDEIVITKAKKESYRTVWLDRQSQDFLKRYLDQRTDTNPALFVNNRGRRMTQDALTDAVASIGRLAGYTVTPHMLRHSFATYMIKQGCGIRYIQEFLGHADIGSTQIYTHIANPDLRAVYHKYRVEKPSLKH